MANKPGVLCTLQKDRLIDTQPGFVDTFNWLVAAVNNLKGGQNCDVSWPAPDTPQIDANAPEGGGSTGGGVGAVQFTGTDGVAGSAGSAFTFASASDSNVVVTASGTTITIGVYWT